MRKLTILLALLCTISISFAQQERKCGVLEHQQALFQEDPEMETRMQQIEDFTNQILSNGAVERAVDGVITIPVVVHVLWNVNQPQQNLSIAQIQSQIDVMNEDFRRLNDDASETLPEFVGVAADYEIEFCLATTDPQGNPTNGVESKSSTRNTWGTGTVMKRTAQGGFDAWPMGSYLNMWSCNIGGGILGFATFPGGNAANDGVVASPNYFGSKDYDINNDFYLSSPFDLGRTMTHEVGHWLNLRHIWGDGACGVDDGVSDTPNSNGSNYGCPLNHVSCTTKDMVQNYMDYTDDACMNIFTQGQKDRSRALFEPGGFRAALLNSVGCGEPEPACLPPSGVVLESVEDNSALINFNGAFYGDSYDVELAIWDAEFELIDNIADPQFGEISNISYLLEELESCTEYSIRFSAICDNLNGYETSQTLVFMTTGEECAPPTCDIPQDLYATDIGWQRATLGWSATENAESYRVQGRLKGGLGIFVRTKILEETSFRTNALFPFLTYEFRVQSMCSEIGNSNYSSWFPFTLNPITNPGIVGNEDPNLLEEVKLFDTDHIISAFPNPSSGTVNVAYSHDLELGNIRLLVTDITGKNIQEYDLDLLSNGIEQFDLSGLNNGLYLLSLRKDGVHLHTEKVMIAK